MKFTGTLVVLLLFAACIAAAQQPTEEQTARAVGAMRTINTAEVTYASSYQDRGFVCDLEPLGEAPNKAAPSADHAGFVDATLRNGKERNGYIFKVFCKEKRTPQTSFFSQAEPIGGKGRAFCSDQTGVIRSSDDGKASTCFKSGTPIK